MQLCSLSDNLSGPSLLACRQGITKQSFSMQQMHQYLLGSSRRAVNSEQPAYTLDVSSKDTSQMHLAVAYLTWKGVVCFEMHVWRDHHLVYVVNGLSQF